MDRPYTGKAVVSAARDLDTGRGARIDVHIEEQEQDGMRHLFEGIFDALADGKLFR